MRCDEYIQDAYDFALEKGEFEGYLKGLNEGAREGFCQGHDQGFLKGLSMWMEKDQLDKLLLMNKEDVDMNPVEPSPTPKEPCVEVSVQGDWIIDINYSKGALSYHTKTYRLGEEYVEEEAVREAYTMFIAELGVEYSNSLLASADIVIMNAGKLPTPSYRTIKLN